MTNPTVQFSVVIPVYGSPESLPELVKRIGATMARMSATYEIVLVDDRCPLDSWTVIENLAARNPHIIGIRFSRNFGQHPAIYAGLAAARGEWIVVMDCDLQDEPEEIEALFARTSEGCDIVRARRVVRRDNYLRRWFSRNFYRCLTFLTDVKHSEEIGNFGVYGRKVIAALLSWDEAHRYFPSAIQWIGFTKCDLEVRHAPRKYGKSSYSLRRLMRLALSIVISFSDKPLRLIAYFGLIVALLSMTGAVALLVLGLSENFAVPGWASIVTCLCFIGGVIILSIGVNGIYLGQVLREAKGRPQFIVDRLVGADGREALTVMAARIRERQK